MSTFADRLVLARWALQQLGVQDFETVAGYIRPPEIEGWNENGGTLFVEELIARLPKEAYGRPVSDEQLREYDQNIVGHWKAITEKRNTQGPTLYPIYFQYLALLFTELYLDRYFRDRPTLLEGLNLYQEKFVEESAQAAPVPVPTRGRGRAAAVPEVEPFTDGELNKLAFWMATGSGKTLLMHCNIQQYIAYAKKHGKDKDLNRIILLTPNEGLSKQHLEEFALSGIPANLYDKAGPTLFSQAKQGVDIIDIHKLAETSGDKTVAISTFEGNNLVLVDEGHRGSGGDEWMKRRAALCEGGFSFEYSATFGQAIKAAGTGARQRGLIQTYAKSILFDYSYKFFYHDGYGKDFNVLNLSETKEDETRPLYLTACLLGFYQQCRRFAQGGPELVPYLLEAPLLVFVGGSVTGKRQDQEDSDLVQILKFLAAFVADRAGTIERLGKLLSHTDDLLVGGKRVFEGFFPFVETIYKSDQAEDLFDDILKHVFNAPGRGLLHIVRLQGSDGEIGLRIGDHPWFGVVNVGDPKKLADLCKDRKNTSESYVVEDMPFSGSLFAQIKDQSAGIKMLAGAKKFTEGWSSWRVTAMGLMNVGQKEGSEIIQLFGRGVRLKGFGFKLKRTNRLDALDFKGEREGHKHPDHIALLETLNIFGIKSDYMKEFQEYLEEEGVGDEDKRELVTLPSIRLAELDKPELKLHVIRPKADMPEFKREVRERLASLEGSLSGKVSLDYYPRLQKQSSLKTAGGGAAVNMASLRTQHLAFLNWDAIWFAVERHKRDKAYYNIVFTPDDLRAILAKPWWYELAIPATFLEFKLERRTLWQEVAIQLLKGYLDKFYLHHKREFEAPHLEYQVLRPKDDLILDEYQFLVKKSETALIQQLKDLSATFKKGTFEALKLDNLDIFSAPHHLYQPLIHLSALKGGEAAVKVIPTHLNDGEKNFVQDLEAFCKKEALGKLAGMELYLLRNHNSDKAVSFFAESGFRPDFLLWLLKEGRQVIAFIDPKGLGHIRDNFNNPKVQLHQKVKTIESDLGRKDIILESYLISQTHRNDLRWPSPASPGGVATADEYLQRHILNAKDDKDTYIPHLMAELTQRLEP
jgi:hypothetical protein